MVEYQLWADVLLEGLLAERGGGLRGVVALVVVFYLKGRVT